VPQLEDAPVAQDLRLERVKCTAASCGFLATRMVCDAGEDLDSLAHREFERVRLVQDRRSAVPRRIRRARAPADSGRGALGSRAARSSAPWDPRRRTSPGLLQRRLTEISTNAQYHVLSGRRIVATRNGPCAREVALEYVRSMGCKRDEIRSLVARRRVSSAARGPGRRSRLALSAAAAMD
jgi:hypothetical protein